MDKKVSFLSNSEFMTEQESYVLLPFVMVGYRGLYNMAVAHSGVPGVNDE